MYLLSNHFIFAMLASHLTRLSNKFVFYANHFFILIRADLFLIHCVKEAFQHKIIGFGFVDRNYNLDQTES